MIGYRSLILKQMLTLEILNRMSIVKQIDFQKRIERTIQTLKPAMQLQPEKLKLIRLSKQKLALMNLIDWSIQMLEPSSRIDSLKSTLELATLTGWPIQIPEPMTRIDWPIQIPEATILIHLPKRMLVPRSQIDLKKLILEPRIQIDWLKRMLESASLTDWLKLILVPATLIDWLKSTLELANRIDSLKSTLELATLTGWQIQIPEATILIHLLKRMLGLTSLID